MLQKKKILDGVIYQKAPPEKCKGGRVPVTMKGLERGGEKSQTDENGGRSNA